MTPEQLKGAEKMVKQMHKLIGHTQCSPMCTAHNVYFDCLDWLKKERQRQRRLHDAAEAEVSIP
jgi:hypothetical protein